LIFCYLNLQMNQSCLSLCLLKKNGYLMHFVKSGVNITDDYHAQNLIGCVMVSVGSNRMKPKTKSYF
jgi:hypothetical protein